MGDWFCGIQRLGFTGFVVAVLTTRLPAADPVSATAPVNPAVVKISPEIAARLRDLEDPNYQVRERAVGWLNRRGPEMIEVLMTLVNHPSTEVRLRAIEILRRFFASDDEAISQQAEAALQLFEEASTELTAERVAIGFLALEPLRERRAVLAIRKLGAIVKYTSRRAPGQFPAEQNANEPAEDEEDLAIDHVMLGKDWKGGDDGLKHLRRIPNLQVLYRTKSGKVSNEALAELTRDMPGLRIQLRGDAHLGISAKPFGDRVSVDFVNPGSPAQKAGIKAGDEILKFGDVPVENFEHLIKLIGEKSPGDTVEVELEHLTDATPRKIPVTLGEWHSPIPAPAIPAKK